MPEHFQRALLNNGATMSADTVFTSHTQTSSSSWQSCRSPSIFGILKNLFPIRTEARHGAAISHRNYAGRPAYAIVLKQAA